MKLKFFVLPAAAVTAAGMLIAPQEVVGFTTIGGSLSQSQRDVRVFDTFADSTANDNTTPDPNWPGYTGAELAIWKACVEWSSELHGGTGAGDPLQLVGDGGANFDPSWQGNATAVGGLNDNTHSPLSGSSGGTLAFMEGPISDGWRIRYYEGWTWDDGPGSVPSGRYDLQSVACHEFGHALGLGHSSTPSATMWGSIGSGSESQRSIAADDQAGVQFIYGLASASKPHIDSVALSGGGTTVTITGTNFSATDNEVWFTQATAGGDGTPVKAIGLTSDGTTIVAGFPGNAGSGDLLVKQGGTSGNAGLSNPFPFDAGGIVFPPATQVNIDLGIALGAPGTGQGGAANNLGFWNSYDVPTSSEVLISVDQSQTASTFGHDGTAGEFVFDEPSSSGFYEKLFDDGHDVGCIGTPLVTYTFGNFAPGTYDVYVYSWALENPTGSFTDIEVLGGQKGKLTCGGIPFQTNLIEGGNYIRDQVTISAGQPIQVTAERNSGCARINGFQILPGTACGLAVNYCTAGTSASGCQAVLSATGTPSATAASGFVLQAGGVEGAKDALFFFGTNGQQANSWGSGTSFQCVVPPVIRGGLLTATGTTGACDGTFAQDLNALWSANPAKNPGAGAIVNAQLWYRDPLNTSNQTTSLSDALSFTVCP